MPRARARRTRPEGAPRARSGPRTMFPVKEPKPYCVLLTRVGGGKLRASARRLKVSRSDVVEALLRKYAEALTSAEVVAVGEQE